MRCCGPLRRIGVAIEMRRGVDYTPDPTACWVAHPESRGGNRPQPQHRPETSGPKASATIV